MNAHSARRGVHRQDPLEPPHLEQGELASEPGFRHELLVVAIPAFNEERFIGDAVASLRAQSWTDFLAVVSDNASSDGTRDACLAAIDGDPRFHYFRHPENRGGAGNFNWILGATQSRYIMWLGAHDMISPNFLERHLRALEGHPEYSLSYSRTHWVDEGGAPLKVTNPSALDQIRGRPLQRFFDCVRRLRECTPINNVIRRSALGGARFQNVAASDQVVLAELLFHGPAHLAEETKYIRREIVHRADYMERLTGQPGQRMDKTGIIPLYLSAHDRLVRFPLRLLTRRLLESLLQKSLRGRYTTADRIHFRIMEWLGLR